MQDKKISIIVPVKNNEKEIANSTKELVKVKNENNFKNFEIIFIDDLSDDSSWEKIITQSREYPNIVKGIKLGRNYGQQLASYIGMKHALNSDYVITLDCDLEDDPNNIVKLINELIIKKSDCILTITSFQGPILYKFFSKIYYLVMGTWTNIKSAHRHTNLRIYNKPCVNSLMELNPSFFNLTHSAAHINAKIDYLMVNKFIKERVSSYTITSKTKLAISTLFEFSDFINSIFIFLFLIVILFIIFYYFYNIYIYIALGSLSGFFSLISFLTLIIFMISTSFIYLNHKLNSIIQFLYKGMDKKNFDNYFNILEKVGFD
jgi:glycosyltransferase involved in cell wall biosynthesis